VSFKAKCRTSEREMTSRIRISRHSDPELEETNYSTQLPLMKAQLLVAANVLLTVHHTEVIM
jgi:hypothetical protein